jgi:hypothetical protein
VKRFKEKQNFIYFRKRQKAEGRFSILVAEAETQQAKNMHPLDALKGMLRWKLVKLMS